MAISFYIREVVWCDFEKEPNAKKPEFLGRHLVIILSTKNKPNWPHLVIPLTSKQQDIKDETVYKLTKPLINKNKDDWAICSHIYSVSHSRLKRPNRKIRVSEIDFEAIKEKSCIRLPFESIKNLKNK